MRSLTTRQGTAMAEASLCDHDHADPSARRVAINEARRSLEWDRSEAFTDTTGNDALECAVCGVNDS